MIYFLLRSSSNFACFSVSDRLSSFLTTYYFGGGVGTIKTLSVVLMFDSMAGERLSLVPVLGFISVDEFTPLTPRSLTV